MAAEPPAEATADLQAERGRVEADSLVQVVDIDVHEKIHHGRVPSTRTRRPNTVRVQSLGRLRLFPMRMRPSAPFVE